MLDAVRCAYIGDGTVERGFGRRALGSEEAIHGEAVAKAGMCWRCWELMWRVESCERRNRSSVRVPRHRGMRNGLRLPTSCGHVHSEAGCHMHARTHGQLYMHVELFGKATTG
jgi:hypothetical protein